jgi:hypothetical protein
MISICLAFAVQMLLKVMRRVVSQTKNGKRKVMTGPPTEAAYRMLLTCGLPYLGKGRMGVRFAA